MQDELSCNDFKRSLSSEIQSRCKIFYPIDEFSEVRSTLAKSVTGAAAAAFTFHLIIAGEIKDSYLPQLYKLFFHLKNLGFARVVVVNEHPKVKYYCDKLNVYYDKI